MITRMVVAFEAGRDGFWLARWLRARGIEAYVIHPTSVAVSREHRRAKTDRLDTELHEHHGLVAMDLPNTRLWRDDPRPMASSPLIVVPTASSEPSCSKLSRCGLARPEYAARLGATANLDSSGARRLCNTAGRGEETGFQVEQRNWNEGSGECREISA
jgi:hypothetical protein